MDTEPMKKPGQTNGIEMESDDEGLDGDAGEDDDKEADSEEEAELVAPEDPRAGGVHAVIPQLAMDYQPLCLQLKVQIHKSCYK